MADTHNTICDKVGKFTMIQRFNIQSADTPSDHLTLALSTSSVTFQIRIGTFYRIFSN